MAGSYFSLLSPLLFCTVQPLYQLQNCIKNGSPPPIKALKQLAWGLIIYHIFTAMD